MKLAPLRQAAARAQHLGKSQPSDETRATYCSQRNLYFHALECEKHNSWRIYMLTVETLFQAKKHATGTKRSNIISTLIDHQGHQCLSNASKAKTLFRATCVATSECDLSNIIDHPFPRTRNNTSTYLSSPLSAFSLPFIFDSLNSSHPLKAPGPDNIQNWV